jgi:hypothetical protein
MATAFKAVRERITPGDNRIWELKHKIPGAIVTKTRGTYTVAPKGWNGAGVVLAKAGYMTPPEALDLSEIEQCRVWIERYRERNFATKMRSKSLTSLRTQHLLETDLQTVVRDVQWNADYDMKRKPVNVRNVDGLIAADTAPWRNINEFERARDQLEGWKRSQRRVLKTKQDYDDMTNWAVERESRRRIGVRADNTLSPVAAATLKILAHRMEGSASVLAGQLWHAVERPRLNARAAKLMATICGVKVTETQVKNARRRGAGPGELAGSIATLTDDDRRFLTAWLSLYTLVPEVLDIAVMLCAPESAAAGEIDDLFDDATYIEPDEQDGPEFADSAVVAVISSANDTWQ